jgi:hypothetical protein
VLRVARANPSIMGRKPGNLNAIRSQDEVLNPYLSDFPAKALPRP